ncbi:MAG: hypothetical protein PSV35_07995, partial [bacterium]|nr:hypothetical protein [bacterium]
ASGYSLSINDRRKGLIVINLAGKLRQQLDIFFNFSLHKTRTAEKLDAFTTQFKTLLHSEDKLMQQHSAVWKPILANILLALTGVGLVAIAIKTIHAINNTSSISWIDCCFFTKTNRQKQIEQIEKSFEIFPKFFASPRK